MAGKGDARPPGERIPRKLLSIEAFQALQEASRALVDGVAERLKGAELSPTQLNVLQILGSGPEAGCSCGELSALMLHRVPDVTRLVDRLERRGLVVRRRGRPDRRVVRVALAPAGVELLAALERPVRDLHVEQFRHLGRKQLGKLVEILRSLGPRGTIGP